ncbi:MAG: glycosyltransferase family 4 protein [Saccharofermentanales bacterium]
MRILHWDEMFHPSFGYQINLLAKFQVKQGHEVIIVTSDKIEEHPAFASFGNKEDINHADDFYSKMNGVKILRLPINGIVSSRVIYKRGYLKSIKELNPDVIMCHTNDTLSAIRIAQKHKYLNIPIVFDNHMLVMASLNPLSRYFRAFFRLFITPIIKKKGWTVIRTQDDNYVNKYLGIPKEQTPFISFGSDTTLFHPDEETRMRFRKDYTISENDFIVVYTGKLDKAKGGKFLAETFKKDFIYEREIVLIVVGNTNGEYGKEVEDIFSKSENRVLRFSTQKYTELARFYQSSDLAIFPKQCSLSFYDAQACGLPVLSEDNNINVDRLQNSNGFNFKAGDIADFREKILFCAMMTDKDYSIMKQNAVEFIRKNYDYEIIAKQYTDILINEVGKFETAINK